MTNGLGAGLFALMLVAVLGLVAGGGTLLAVVALVYRGRGETAQQVLRVLALLLLTVTVGVAGFGVLALYDEAPAAVWIFLGTVFLPLFAVAVERWRGSSWGWVDRLALAGLAWAPAFVLGAAAFVGLLSLPDVAFTASIALASTVAVAGSVAVGRTLDGRWQVAGD